MYKVLLVDDDVHILNANETYLSRQGYQISRAEDGEQALKLASSAAFDAIVLDVDMPGVDGVTVCRRLREVSMVPIIFLSAYARTDDRIRGLMAGGDDYIGKPYSLVELELRLRLRIQRHRKVETGEVLRFDALEVDLGLREARFKGDTVPADRAGIRPAGFPRAESRYQVFSYEQLYDRVWKAPMNQGLHNIQVCMARVRQKLDALSPDVHWIETVRRKGYRFNSAARVMKKAPGFTARGRIIARSSLLFERTRLGRGHAHRRRRPPHPRRQASAVVTISGSRQGHRCSGRSGCGYLHILCRRGASGDWRPVQGVPPSRNRRRFRRPASGVGSGRGSGTGATAVLRGCRTQLRLAEFI